MRIRLPSTVASLLPTPPPVGVSDPRRHVMNNSEKRDKTARQKGSREKKKKEGGGDGDLGGRMEKRGEPEY